MSVRWIWDANETRRAELEKTILIFEQARIELFVLLKKRPQNLEN